MKKQFTKKFMLENCGCYKDGTIEGCSFMQAKKITIELILLSEIPLKDKFWFVCKKLSSPSQNALIAIGVAEIVLPVFETKHPKDASARDCIDAAKKFINKEITREELLIKRRAAYAVAVAAYAVAAVAAAYAADAAAYAAYAAYAADAAYYAAAAAAYAADAYDANYGETILQFLINFCANA